MRHIRCQWRFPFPPKTANSTHLASVCVPVSAQSCAFSVSAQLSKLSIQAGQNAVCVNVCVDVNYLLLVVKPSSFLSSRCVTRLRGISCHGHLLTDLLMLLFCVSLCNPIVLRVHPILRLRLSCLLTFFFCCYTPSVNEDTHSTVINLCSHYKETVAPPALGHCDTCPPDFQRKLFFSSVRRPTQISP